MWRHFLALMASTGIQASRPEVRMADKIAMRSLVLSKNMPRIGGKQNLISKIISDSFWVKINSQILANDHLKLGTNFYKLNILPNTIQWSREAKGSYSSGCSTILTVFFITRQHVVLIYGLRHLTNWYSLQMCSFYCIKILLPLLWKHYYLLFFL